MNFLRFIPLSKIQTSVILAYYVLLNIKNKTRSVTDNKNLKEFKSYAEEHKPPNVDVILKIVSVLKRLIGRKSTIEEKQMARSIYILWKQIYDRKHQ